MRISITLYMFDFKYQKHHHPSHHQVFNPINYHLNETKNEIPPITQNIQKKKKSLRFISGKDLDKLK